jgi:hypothetical protein
VNGIALKGKKMPMHSRMLAGKSGPTLEWMIEQGLAWRGTKPPDWKFRPKSLRAAAYLVFHMIPRGLFS